MDAAILEVGPARWSWALVSGQGSEKGGQALFAKLPGAADGSQVFGPAACTNEETMMPDSPEINRGVLISWSLGIFGEPGLCPFENAA